MRRAFHYAVRRIARAAALCTISASLIAFPPAAIADGGNSISSAPAITYGQQEFGNTATGETVVVDEGFATCHRSFWSLSVTAGDEIIVDWEAEVGNTKFNVYPVGTNDFNFESTRESPFVAFALGGNHKDEGKLTAPVGGSMPVMIAALCGDPVGSYAFTAYVRHAVRLSIHPRSTLPTNGTMSVSVRNPEGGAISDPSLQVTLQVLAHGHWMTVGRAPAANAVAMVHFSIPRSLLRKRVSLRAMATGDGYQTATSVGIHVKIN
jgi:hypothetical protein